MKFKHYSGQRSSLPTIGKVIFSFLGIIILLCVCLLLFAVITEYRPDAVTRLTVTASADRQNVRSGQAYSLLTFNIGWCGMDATQDTWLEGGLRAGADSQEAVENNLRAISDEIQKRAPDFVFLQEVDVNSRRSFSVNQQEALQNLLSDHTASFALDYKAPFVPLPLLTPTGRVESGLLSLSSVAVHESARYSFDGEQPFPMRLIQPSYCFLVTRLATDNGGELVLINTRFAPPNADASIRALQLAQMKAFLETEAQAGHYVIAGGDWYGQLPGTDYRIFGYGPDSPDWCEDMPADFTPEGYRWAVYPELPSRRSCDMPYAKGRMITGVSDGFLVSDNIEIRSVLTMDLDFRNAAHNPVLLVFILPTAEGQQDAGAGLPDEAQ